MSEIKNYEDNIVKHADDDRLYYLNLPHLVVGSLTSFNKIVKVLNTETNKIEDKEILYNQTWTKQIDEAIQNSIDEYTRTNGDYSKNIKIDINQQTGWVSISDDGRGINVKDQNYVLAFTKFKTSSNFKFLDDDKKGTDRITIGAHGIGNKVITLFSSEALITSVTLDGDRGTLITKNNMEVVEHKEDVAPKSVKNGMTVKFKSDFDRLEMKHDENGNIISDDLLNHVHALLINIAFSNPGISFTFQGKLVKSRTFNEFIRFYSDESVNLYEDDSVLLAVIPSEEHKFVHIVNSLDLNKGGVALSYITNNVVSKFAERLQKGYSKITSSVVKNRIGIVLVLKGMKNLSYGSGQTKEEIKNTVTELGLPTLNYTDFAEKLFKSSAIKDPIIELYKIQAELEKRKAMKGLKADKKEIFNPKHMKATQDSEFLMIAEGDSALSSLPLVFGREKIGYLPLTGKLLNSLKSKPDQIRKNPRVVDIIEAYGIGLEESRYKNLIIATDADLDGNHITTLIISLFYVLQPQDLYDGKLYKLNTPVMVITDKNDKLVKWYYSLNDYNQDKHNINPSHNCIHKKGLGSHTSEDLAYIVEKDGLESMIEQIVVTPEDGEIIEKWMTDEGVLFRQDVLRSKTFSIENI